jgi:hypothetical protein
MGTFSKKEIIETSPTSIPAISQHIKEVFEADGYEVAIDKLSSGGCDISITKGGLFKAVLGLKSALKVCLTPQHDSVLLEANVGIWGQQIVPFAISLFLFWPVLVTQMWGIIEQSRLDDKVVATAKEAVAANATATEVSDVKICSACGQPNASAARFCNECGNKL